MTLSSDDDDEEEEEEEDESVGNPKICDEEEESDNSERLSVNILWPCCSIRESRLWWMV